MRTPLSLRFKASEVTLSGFAGGEYLPLPASKGLAFPFLLTLDGYPTSPADYAHGQGCSPRNSVNFTHEHIDKGKYRILKLIVGKYGISGLKQ
jgi:hypothetical protein